MALTLDGRKNFAESPIDAAGIAAGATTLTLVTGGAAKFPNPALREFNIVLWNMSDYDRPSQDPDVEIVRVTAVAGDDFTVTRAQEGTADVNHNTGGKTYGVLLAITKKMIDDIESQAASVLSGTGTLGDNINQVAHGFALDDVLKSNSVDGEYALAQADVADNSEVIGVVATVIDADNFTLVTEGFLNLNALPGGAVAGDTLWLSDSVAGGFTLTPPTDAPKVRKPLGVVIDAATKLVYFKAQLGQELTGDLVGGGTKILVDTSVINITNAAETTIASANIPANTLGTNNAVRVKIYVDFDAKNNAAQNVTLKMKYGATTVVTAASKALQQQENGKTFIEAILAADGATNAQVGTLAMACDANVADGNNNVIGENGTAAEDSTVDKTLVITWQFGTAIPSPTCDVYQAVFEKITGVGTIGVIDTPLSLSKNTVYQALTAGILVAVLVNDPGIGCGFKVFSDASNPPTTEVGRFAASGSGNFGTVTVPILAGDYYKVQEYINTGTFVINFYPLA